MRAGRSTTATTGCATTGASWSSSSPEGHGQDGEHDAARGQAGQQPGGAGRVQPPAGRGGQPQEHADPGGHARHGQPVAQLRPPRPGHGQVAEHEQQLGRQDRLNQGQFPEPQAVSWNTNPPIMAAMPSSQAGWRASRTMSRAPNRAGVPGPGALAHRRRRGAHARRDRQQDRLLHQPAPPAGRATEPAGLRRHRPAPGTRLTGLRQAGPRPKRFVMPFITTGAAAAEAASVTGVLTAHRALMFLSVSATPGRANGAIRRFPVGLPPGCPGCKHPVS
jgi:hypothetical protein